MRKCTFLSGGFRGERDLVGNVKKMVNSCGFRETLVYRGEFEVQVSGLKNGCRVIIYYIAFRGINTKTHF